jgi:hypothetical protein
MTGLDMIDGRVAFMTGLDVIVGLDMIVGLNMSVFYDCF